MPYYLAVKWESAPWELNLLLFHLAQIGNSSQLNNDFPVLATGKLSTGRQEILWANPGLQEIVISQYLTVFLLLDHNI